MDEWFDRKRRGKGSRVFAFPRGTKTWFMVRHGEPMRREGRHQDDGGSGIAYYRPQKHDVVIYDGESDFKVKFDGDGKERTVAILPPSLARYDRDADSDLIDRWLKDQGFCRPNVGDEDDDVGVLEDD